MKRPWYRGDPLVDAKAVGTWKPYFTGRNNRTALDKFLMDCKIDIPADSRFG